MCNKICIKEVSWDVTAKMYFFFFLYKNVTNNNNKIKITQENYSPLVKIEAKTLFL